MTHTDYSHMHPKGSGFVDKHTVEKPWGKEEWIVVTPHYVMKFLHVYKGHSLSLQYHEQKTETLTVIDGACTLTLGNAGDAHDKHETHKFNKGQTLHLLPKTVHRFSADEDLVLVEVSTPELWDVVRLEDRYGRK